MVTCDVIASLIVDSSECSSFTYNETCVVRCSVDYTGVGGKNIPELTRDSDGHLQGSLECAEESLESSTFRTLAERVLLCDDHFVQTDGDVSGTQVQNDSGLLSVAKGSSWATIKEVANKTILQHRVAGVSCQPRSCSRAESKSRRLGIPKQHECLVSK